MKIRSRKTGRLLAAAMLVATVSAPAFGQDTPRPADPPPTVGENIRSRVGSAVEGIKRGTASASEAVREQLARARDTINRFGIEQRVYARLHWDKSISAEPIELTSPETGTIVLTGTVSDAAARARAVALTTETLGVTQVVDRLTVRTSTEGGAADVGRAARPGKPAPARRPEK
ncbi:MAG: BON domain-containing protein [Isosphaeraceae bacterium]